MSGEARPVILLVEDSPDDATLIQRAFRKTNLMNPVRLVQDGEEAIDYLSGAGAFADRDRFPLPVRLLLDIQLPRKTGLEVLEWLRTTPSLKRLPVVMLTSSKEQIDVNRAYDLGVNSYLTKPVAFEALMEMVKRVNLYWVLLNEPPDVTPE